jgi:hypothetical protein
MLGLSAAQRMTRLSAASVEMTLLSGWVGMELRRQQQLQRQRQLQPQPHLQLQLQLQLLE